MKTYKYLLPAFTSAALAMACSARPISAPASAAASQAASQTPGGSGTPAPAPVPLRALIVGGGSSPSYSQAGIESNARYVGALLPRARGTRLLWDNGLPGAATVASVSSNRDDYLARLAMAFAVGRDWPEETVSFRAPRLPRLDGGVSKASIQREISGLGRSLGEGETALLYFTGHGSPGVNPSIVNRIKSSITGRPSNSAEDQDFDNTLYWMWGDKSLSVQEVAPMLKSIPARNPLVVVMVQCYAGGFANLMFKNGDPSEPIETRDVCGFFAATADRMSSGCTASIDEAGSEDFTTHFFAALSNRGRGARPVLESDFDKSGRTSMLEAFAYANLHDRSIDVPTCTSKEFLMHLFPPTEKWYINKFAPMYARAAPWQKATLRGLSRQLKLSGDNRLDTAARRAFDITDRMESGMGNDSSTWSKDLLRRSQSLKRTLERRYPGLKRASGSQSYARARQSAYKYLLARPNLWRDLARGIERESLVMETDEVREAMLLRFVDACFTLIAEQKLQSSGTLEQKAAFARLRASEARSLFEPR